MRRPPATTNTPAAAFAVTSAPAAPGGRAGTGYLPAKPPRGGGHIRILFSTLGFGGALTVLGFLAAQDLGRLLKFRLGREVTYMDARSERNDQFARAQHLALKGKHAAALKLLQGILARHPQHAHTLLLAAEIHDKELGDYAAATLLYAQLLRLDLPAEQWGWIAIRLANIYSGKLGQPDAAIDLMKRLATQHPDTQPGPRPLSGWPKSPSRG